MTERNNIQSGEDFESNVPDLPDTIHFCNFCDVKEIDPGLKRTSFSNDLSSGTVVRYRGSRVLDGASNGCAFFLETLNFLESILSAHGYEQGSASPNFRPENWRYELSFSDYTGYLETARGAWRCVKGELLEDTQCPQQERASYLVLAHQGTRVKQNVTTQAEAYKWNAGVGDPAAETIPIRPFLHDFGGESVAWARRRLGECELLHQDCMAPGPLLSPTRLLRIDPASGGSGICVRLKLTASSEVIKVTTEKYATLSYCWGGPQAFKLTSSSEDILMRGISASLLPKTLRDAVQVTWDLGIKWIWIDSLCIRQDDPEEKATEVAQMRLIYANSFVTISATKASHCHQGFLHQSSLPNRETVGYKLPFASPCGRLGSVILSSNKMSPRSPVDDRGWTLQEHLFGRKILRFTDFGLHWSCKGTSMFEEENPGTLPSLPVKNLGRAYGMYRGIRGDNRKCKHWMNIVEEYTRRELTDGSDKLPAMSGIAEWWAQTSEDHYIAGLWISHLPLGLLWTSAQPFLQDESRAYRAPSWSWASLDGQVDWFDRLFTKVDPMLKVGSCIVTPTHPQALYGAVQSGFLMVQGLLQETVMDEVSTILALVDQENESLDLDLADVHLDFWDKMLASKVEGAKLFCLQICCFDESTAMGPSGLILTTKDEHLFSRVGFFAFERPHKYDVQELKDFDTLLKLSEDRKLVQRSAFQDIVPRSITII